MPPVVWHSIKLDHILQETKFTKRFQFSAVDEAFPAYQPGQFVVCDLPIGERRNQRWRSYSLASAWQPNALIEFCISYKPGGPASEFFFNQIKVGDVLRVKSPEGQFVIPKEEDKHLFLICTGTGIAPFRAMLQSFMNHPHPFASVQLIFGTRHWEDILYQDDWTLWNERIPHFKGYVALSREQHHPVGISSPYSIVPQSYVHQVYTRICEANPEKKESGIFMLCGWSAMIDEAVIQLFQHLKIPREHIKFELYG